MTELLDIANTLKTIAALTDKTPGDCERVIAAAVDVLHDEMVRRGKADPTLYGQVQDGTYRYNLGEHLEPATFLPGDWWTEVCRRSQTDYPEAEKLINHFRDLWLASGKFFEPLGTLVTNGRPADNIWFSLSLRRDFIGPTITIDPDRYDGE